MTFCCGHVVLVPSSLGFFYFYILAFQLSRCCCPEWPGSEQTFWRNEQKDKTNTGSSTSLSLSIERYTKHIGPWMNVYPQKKHVGQTGVWSYTLRMCPAASPSSPSSSRPSIVRLGDRNVFSSAQILSKSWDDGCRRISPKKKKRRGGVTWGFKYSC